VTLSKDSHRTLGTMLAVVCGAIAGPVQAAPCANAVAAQSVRQFFAEKRPGVPLPVAARALALPESVVASGLERAQVDSASATPERVRQIWKSIDAWGPRTQVKLVLAATGSLHSFAFPSLVPITQPDDGSGFLDVYADGGAGVHAHIQVAHVAAIFATDVPTASADKRTRAISFHDTDGRLILGVYAQIAKDPFDPAAVAGFARTRALVASLPGACPAPSGSQRPGA
jgi:putative heme iron utilization protein